MELTTISLQNLLERVYSREVSTRILSQLENKIRDYQIRHPAEAWNELSEKDVMLITYGDQISASGETPLFTLHHFCKKYFQEIISAVHLLPFYPYTSDDGFSVVDYSKIDPQLGTWNDVSKFSRDFQLMFDAVFNHISAQSPWFQGYLKGDPKYHDFFIEVDPKIDLSQVVRPRALPLLTRFDTPTGPKHVWTTFSEDQVDLNIQNPEVLIQLCKILLFYFEQGARFVRLDAIAFLWKEIGTPCLHLPQAHTIIQFLRGISEAAVPGSKLITETNVPHQDNISYFGNGTNEAHLVYNFALPPLTLHTLHTEDSTKLCLWASDLTLPSNQVTFFNFLASHDGIGVNPVRGILSETEIDILVSRIQSHGGLISYKNTPSGGQIPYELNINYFDALSNPYLKEDPSLPVLRFLTAHAIMFSISGVPGIYIHSLLGSQSWMEGVKQTGRNRTLNREKFDLHVLEKEFLDPHHRRHQVFSGLKKLLQARRNSTAFHPYTPHQTLDLSASLFSILRNSPEGNQKTLCLHNVTSRTVSISIHPGDVFQFKFQTARDLLSEFQYSFSEAWDLQLQPYQTLWLSAETIC